MIKNRPKYLEAIPFYRNFPGGFNLEIDYGTLPEILNLNLHQLNGLQPIIKSKMDFVGKNSVVDGKATTTIRTNDYIVQFLNRSTSSNTRRNMVRKWQK
jgi:hypothetical protein